MRNILYNDCPAAEMLADELNAAAPRFDGEAVSWQPCALCGRTATAYTHTAELSVYRAADGQIRANAHSPSCVPDWVRSFDVSATGTDLESVLGDLAQQVRQAWMRAA